MFAVLNKLWAALASLTAAVHDLTGVIDATAGKLRQSMALDPAELEAPVVPRITHQPAEVEPADRLEADALPAKQSRNGRAKDRAAV